VAAANHASPIAAGPSQGAFLASSQGALTPDATANRLNQQFFAGYPGPPLTTPPTLLAAQPTAGPAPVNGTPGILPPLAQYLPPTGPSGTTQAGYAPGYEERRENGDAPPNPPTEGFRPPQSEQNGQDTEMGEAGTSGFGGGFTAVNR
jgi:hypothetical protein